MRAQRRQQVWARAVPSSTSRCPDAVTRWEAARHRVRQAGASRHAAAPIDSSAFNIAAPEMRTPTAVGDTTMGVPCAPGAGWPRARAARYPVTCSMPWWIDTTGHCSSIHAPATVDGDAVGSHADPHDVRRAQSGGHGGGIGPEHAAPDGKHGIPGGRTRALPRRPVQRAHPATWPQAGEGRSARHNHPRATAALRTSSIGDVSADLSVTRGRAAGGRTPRPGLPRARVRFVAGFSLASRMLHSAPTRPAETCTHTTGGQP